MNINTQRLKTQILSPGDIQQAAAYLKEGQLVAFPAETVYGLGAPIFLTPSIRKIFEVKGRPPNNPLIAHISDLAQIHAITVNLPEVFFKLAKFFFPGPLTIVVEKRENVPEIASGGLTTIGVRMPSHPVARHLIECLGEPIVAPSANLSGKPSSTSVDHVLEDFSGKIAAVIDGGKCHLGIESTVVLLKGNEIILLRPGVITPELITQTVELPVRSGSKRYASLSPGMQYRHYAPRAHLHLFYQTQKYHQYPSTKKQLRLQSITSQTLYSSLREADRQGYEEILILCTAEMQADTALMDRLTRASEKKE